MLATSTSLLLASCAVVRPLLQKTVRKTSVMTASLNKQLWRVHYTAHPARKIRQLHTNRQVANPL